MRCHVNHISLATSFYLVNLLNHYLQGGVIMIRIKFFIAILGILLLFSCRKKSPNEPPNENSHPQVDIPWPSLADSPWPMHHHDPQSTGRSSNVGPQQGSFAWKFNVGAPVGTSVAIGPDSTIYFASSYEMYEGRQVPILYALDWHGNLKWKFKLRASEQIGDASQACSPLVAADGTIYIGSRDHLIYAINPDGTLKWTFKADDDIYPISLAIGLDGKIYFTAADTRLYCINPDGTLNWKSGGNYQFLCSPLAGISISPDGTTLYLGTAELDTSYGLAAVDISGQLRWLYKTGLVDCTPLVDNDGNIFFGAGKGLNSPDEGKTGLFSLNSQGQLRWKYQTAYMNNKDVCMDYDGNVYSSVNPTGTESRMISMTNKGELRWDIDISAIGALTSSLICDFEGNIYGSAWYSTLYAISSSGDINWQSSVGQINGNSPAIAKGRLYVGTWYKEPGKELLSIK